MFGPVSFLWSSRPASFLFPCPALPVDLAPGPSLVMDILSDASDGSGSSSVDEAAPMAFRANARLSAPVGQCTNLAHFAGQCVGDDMSWKGSKTLRVACLQCGSVGRDLWHAHSLTCLGADIGILTETASAHCRRAGNGRCRFSHRQPRQPAWHCRLRLWCATGCALGLCGQLAGRCPRFLRARCGRNRRLV